MKSKKIFRHFLPLILVLFSFSSFAQSSAKEDVLLQVMQKELDRNMKELKQKDIPVYLLSYRVEDVKTYSIGSTFGNLDYSRYTVEKILTVQVRVGSKKLDNYHELRDDMSDYFTDYREIQFPLTDDVQAIEQFLWRETDQAYRDAVQRFEKVKANVAVKVESDDKAPDYSDAEQVDYYESPIVIKDFNQDEWIGKLRQYSTLFTDNKEIINGSAYLNFYISRKYFVNSEGSSIVQNNSYSHLFLNARTQADDGMELPLYKSYFAYYPGDLPQSNIIENDAKKMISTLLSLRTAPVVDSYTGPALLSNDAAGVFFHEIFGHRVEGQRMKSENDGQTFKKKLNELVLNEDISVIFDPTIQYYKGIPLNGSYVYDDEGVKSQRTVVVDKGVLKNFLMTRTPIDSFPQSNGHARAAAGMQPVSRQSNLIVETQKSYTDAELRQMLIDEAKRQGKDYGYLFAKVQGGFTMTGRYFPNSFNVIPLEVYRIYVDGRPDELVRGVDLVGTPLAMFSKIEAVGNNPGNFAGFCGAESGSIPAGCCSPALFVKQIEMQKKAKSQDKPPIIERSSLDNVPNDNFETVVFKAMQDEMTNNMANLKIEDLKSPYYISYLVSDANMMVVESSLGAITLSDARPYRDQETTVLVGSDKFNNLNFFDENSLFGFYYSNRIAIPENIDYSGIRNSLWLTTDQAYKNAAESIENKEAVIKQQNQTQEQKELPDFSEVEIQTSAVDVTFENVLFSNLLNTSVELSRVFLNYPDFINSGANIYIYQANTYYLNSEGMKYKQPFSLACLRVFAETLTPDGESVMDYFNIYVNSYTQLPNMDVLRDRVVKMADLLKQIRNAPVMNESFSGPVMFTGDAVGEIVAQSFVESNNGLLAGRKPITPNTDFLRWYESYIPQANATEALIGKKVISRDLSVMALDGKTSYNGIPLIGSYKVDAEGVRVASEIPLVSEGILVNILSNRIPTNYFKYSNGHNRLALSNGKLTTSLCSGVIELSGKNKMSYSKMKKKLIAMAKEEDYEYAYIIPELVSQNSGVPSASIYQTKNNSYYPVYVIRISVKDGSETLMRMAKVSALNMKSFKHVEAISNQQQVYNTLLKGKQKNKIMAGQNFDLAGVPCSFIVPTAILFPELDVEKNPSIILKKQPEVLNPLLEKK